MKYKKLFPANKYIKKYIQNLKTLEIACGSGKLTEYMRGKGISTTCSDILKEEQVDVIHDLNKPFPWSSGEFEQVICVDSLELLENPNNVFKETHRILKKNGYFIVTVPRSFFYFNSKMGHKSYFTPTSIKFTIKQNGFKIIKTNHFYFIPYLTKTIKVPSELLASHLVFLLQKK